MKTVEIEYEKWIEKKELQDSLAVKQAFIAGYEKGRSDKIEYSFEQQMQK